MIFSDKIKMKISGKNLKTDLKLAQNVTHFCPFNRLSFSYNKRDPYGQQ